DATRELVQEFRDVTRELRDVTRELRDVTRELRDVSRELRDVTCELRDVTCELHDVTRELRGVAHKQKILNQDLTAQVKELQAERHHLDSIRGKVPWNPPNRTGTFAPLFSFSAGENVVNFNISRIREVDRTA